MTKPKQVIDKREYFQQLNLEVRDQLFAANLTACEWRFWVYLVTLDPFGDNGKDFDPSEVMRGCGMGKSTYFEAKAKFQKLGWFDFKDGQTRVTNLQGCKRSKKPIQDSLDEVRNSGESVRNFGVEIRDSGQPVRDFGVEVRDFGVEVQNFGVEVQNFGVPVRDSGVEHNNDRACIQTLQTYTDFLQTEADCTVAATEPFECVVDAVCSHSYPLETLPESRLPGKQTTGTNTSQVTQPLQPLELQREKKTSSEWDNFSAAAKPEEIQLQIQRMAYDWRLRPWMLNATEFQPQMKAAVWRSNPQEYSIRGTDIPNEIYVTNHLRKLNQQLKNPHSADEAYAKLQTYWRTAIALVNPEIQSEFSSLKAASKQFAQASLLAERKQHTYEAIKDLL